MSFTFKLARRTARFRAASCATLLLSSLACNAEETAAPVSEPTATPVTAPASTVEAPAIELLTSATAPGIPFGDAHLETFTAPYTGALLALWPGSAAAKLNTARSTGMRIFASVVGNRKYYTNSDRTFSMTKWKQRVAAWRSFPFGTYVSSGTVLAHYLIDEPTCSSCWGGKPITTSQLEEMAKYSKSIWPSMPTAIRAFPTKLANVRFSYVDVAWAQWEGPKHGASFKLTPQQFRDQQVAAAQTRGLGLVFGLNYLDGGDGSSHIAGTYPNSTSSAVNRWQMSATEVKNVGAVLAAASYGCAVVSWKYNTTFLNRTGMKSAISYVAGIAKNRSRASCVR